MVSNTDSKKRKFNSKKKAEEVSNSKRALKQARQSHRPHAETVVAAKELWNKLRVKTNTAEQNTEMMDKLMDLLTGKFNQVALQHDASRVVQAAIQFATENQRRTIIGELCDGGNIVELSKSQYAHFVVLKMIKYCAKDDDLICLIVKVLKRNIAKLAVHAVGARVVELLFSTFPPKRTANLKLEFYGPHFGLFHDRELANKVTNVNIDYIISNQPSGKDAALNSLLSLINKGIEKGLFSFAYFQQILFEYVTVATPNDVRSLCSSLVDHSIHLLSTKAGARVVAECATYGTPKDRKRILKSLKGYTRSTLLHSDAYIALLRVLDVTDDTVNVQKALLTELHVLPEKKPKMNVLGEDENDDKDAEGKPPLLELILSETGSKLFLWLLSKDENTKKKYFDPAELEVLRPNTTIKEGNEEVPTSKKSANARRVELLQYMKNLLCDCCKLHTNELLQSRCGAKVLREVYESFPSKDLAQAIVDACENEEEADDEYMSVFEHPIGHLSIKNIISCDVNTPSKDNNSVTQLLLNNYGGKLIDDVGASNRGAFVLVSLLASDGSGAAKKELKKAKKEVKKRLDQAKSMSKSCAGYEALLKAIED
mmetsp:Transcript_11778/g.22042  ORF Transcript_11778/g.22042 Transcript_11778/m.22042 type:complete len:598 (+) Transcript_11778:112-1905(+)